MLQTDIYVFDDSSKCWSKFTGQQVNRKLRVEPEAIYLKHCYRAHYEVVLSVEDENDCTLKTQTSTKTDNSNVCSFSNVETDAVNEHQFKTNKKAKQQSTENTTDANQHVNGEDETSIYERKILQGSCHQGHSKFGSSAGKQCVMNSLVSLMYSKVKPIRDWNSEDMNVVLNTGNELYQFLTRSSTMHDQYVLISEIPRQLECFNKNYCFEFGESLTGLIYPGNCLTDPGFQTYTLNDAISMSLIMI